MENIRGGSERRGWACPARNQPWAAARFRRIEAPASPGWRGAFGLALGSHAWVWIVILLWLNAALVAAIRQAPDDGSTWHAIAACISTSPVTAVGLIVVLLFTGPWPFCVPNISPDQFRRVLEVNLVGPFVLTQAALPHLIETKGSIVNVSSTSALAGMPYVAAYGTSKGGVSAFTRTIAVEFGKRGVRCNAVNPGSIQTSMMGPDVMPESVDMKLVIRAQPLDESRPPEVVAAVIAMLASEGGAHINGEEIRVDGGTLA